MTRSRTRTDTLSDTAPLFMALGDPTRLQIVGRLCREGPLSVAQLTASCPVTRQAVSKHLRVLADAGLAQGRRKGREQVWQIQPQRLDEARRHLDCISTQWDAALRRLQSLVEKNETIADSTQSYIKCNFV
ncbi:MAG: metalloregulator ArsR/SmtB family transcription factor [Pseudomonadales bacterium]|nr:metalloregulator ArsR/SmtB family transcription factor [Pseudomonadales bacterium]